MAGTVAATRAAWEREATAQMLRVDALRQRRMDLPRGGAPEISAEAAIPAPAPPPGAPPVAAAPVAPADARLQIAQSASDTALESVVVSGSRRAETPSGRAMALKSTRMRSAP